MKNNLTYFVFAALFTAACVMILTIVYNDTDFYVKEVVAESALVTYTEQSAETAENDFRKININTAGPDELIELDGIGNALAARIIEYREQNGDFENTYEITEVRGVGDGVYEKIKDRITVK